MFLLNLTENSLNRIQEICQQKGIYALELGIKPGGCAGFEYEWRTAETNTAEINDEIISCYDGKLIVKAEAKPYLHGCEIDYVENLFAQVFEIKNPNTVAECGCGVSLTFDETVLDNNIEILELR